MQSTLIGMNDDIVNQLDSALNQLVFCQNLKKISLDLSYNSLGHKENFI